jgi:drug/metabolite transporter (DMT)-like permease
MKLPWPILSFVAVFCFSTMILLTTVITRRGVSVPLMLLSLSIICIPLYIFRAAATGGISQFSTSTTVILLAAGILSALGNLSQFEAIKAAPNPGLAITIVSLTSGVVAILSFFIFKDKLTFMQVIGIITALVGVSLISLSEKA